MKKSKNKDPLCFVVTSDAFEEGVAVLASGAAILDRVSVGEPDDPLANSLYGVETLLRNALDLLAQCRTSECVFTLSTLPDALKAKMTVRRDS